LPIEFIGDYLPFSIQDRTPRLQCSYATPSRLHSTILMSFHSVGMKRALCSCWFSESLDGNVVACTQVRSSN
jgi:hypothetical protein